MTREPLGQLVPHDFAVTVVGSHHTGLLEHCERAIERGQGDPITDIGVELRRRLRPVPGDEGGDDGTSAPGVTNTRLGQPVPYLALD